MASDLTEAQRAATGFLRNLVTPRDRCFALSFGGRPALLMPLVDDVDAVAMSLEDLRAYGRTALYDAILSSLYYFRGQRGQRALVLLTDGDDTSSSTSWEDALEYARRSGVTLYAIGLSVSGMKLEARSRLTALAETTGGRVFFIAKAEELSGVYDQIEEELRNRYFLAYNADHPADENGWREIDVRAKRGVKVRVSRGYHP
jgi:VWFA-related protein